MRLLGKPKRALLFQKFNQTKEKNISNGEVFPNFVELGGKGVRRL